MPVTDRRRACFLFRADADDPDVQSGRPHAVLSRMAAWADVVRAYPLRVPAEYLSAPILYWHRWRGAYYQREKSLAAARQRARKAMRYERVPFDFWLTPTLDHAAFIDSARPIVVFHDAPFTLLSQSYARYQKIIPRQKREMAIIERDAAQRASLLVYPSDWAARFVVEELGAEPTRVRVIPWGANIDPLPADDVAAVIDRRLQGPPKVLFVGKDWERKGGPTVLAATELLRRHFPDLELHIVGDAPRRLPAHVHHHGLLSMTMPAERALRDRLYAESTVLVVPSTAEALGIVFCETAAMALPSVGRKVGGIPSIVVDGETGRLVPPDGDASAIAEAIESIIGTAEAYRRLSLAAYARYQQRLNWERFDADLHSAVDEMLGMPRPPAERPAMPDTARR